MTSLLLSGSIGVWLDSVFANFDFSVFSFFGNIQDPFLTVIAKGFTSLGSTIFVVLMAVMGLVMIFFKRTRKLGFALVFAVIIGTLITNIVVKPLVLRIRPYNTLQANAQYWAWYVGAGMLSESDFCFPSGHTTGATEIAIVLFMVHLRSKRKTPRALCWVFPLVAIFVGASRIYLMVHYTTDVLAGFIVGIFAGLVGYALSTLVIRIWKNDEERQAIIRSRVKPVGVVAIILAFLVAYAFSAVNVFTSGGQDALRCAYDGDYNCQNEAKEKYQAPDGSYYCKIHWNELNGN